MRGALRSAALELAGLLDLVLGRVEQPTMRPCAGCGGRARYSYGLDPAQVACSRRCAKKAMQAGAA